MRPDFLLLRVLCRSLILWDSIEASEQFVKSQVPEFIKTAIKKKEDKSKYKYTSESEAIEQSYLYVIAGACLSIGIKYAGTQKCFQIVYLIQRKR